MISSLTRARRSLALALAVGLALAACGSDDSSSPSPSTASPASTPAGESSAPATEAATGGSIPKLDGTQLAILAPGSSGVYLAQLQESVVDRFDEATGAQTQFEQSQCGLTKLSTAVETGNVPWALVTMCNRSEFDKAVEAGVLQPIDTTAVPLDLLSDGTYSEYGFEKSKYAGAIAWNTDAFPLDGPHPTSIVDIFDLEKFPGKRCLVNYPEFYGILEAAALHAGSSRDNLYPIDVDAALKELDTIRSSITFVTSSAQGLQSLMTGECVMGTFGNGQVFAATLENEGAPLAMSFGDAITGSGFIGIPKGAHDKDASEALLSWLIQDREGLAKFAAETAYTFGELKDPVPFTDAAAPFALTPQNQALTIAEDADWYSTNLDSILEKFNAWLVAG
ncbi:MAG: extracellular solute-binding protein [Ilumatobacteraceae bacterium]